MPVCAMLRAGKSRCKAELQAELGLAQDEDAMLLGFIGRLDHQKGPDVIIDALPGLASRGVQVRAHRAFTVHGPAFASKYAVGTCSCAL